MQCLTFLGTVRTFLGREKVQYLLNMKHICGVFVIILAIYNATSICGDNKKRNLYETFCQTKLTSKIISFFILWIAL